MHLIRLREERRHLPLSLIAAGLCPPLAAQPELELQLGGGYVNGRGAEGSPPSSGAVQVGGVVWLMDGFGLSGNFISAPGCGRSNGVCIKDDLRYFTTTLRWRRDFGAVEWNYGVGALLGGRFVESAQISGVPVELTNRFNGLFVETLLGCRLTEHFSVKGNAGVGVSAIDENIVLQLTALAAFTF